MQRPTNLKVGDRFRVIEGDGYLSVGEIITLKEDDGSDCPFFWNADKSDAYCAYWSEIEPYTKTIRDAQVGDVVVGKSSGSEYVVLERGQNTVLLSQRNNFKKASENFTFDELEENFTLKDAPEVEQTILTMNEIAEKFGVDVSNLKITKE